MKMNWFGLTGKLRKNNLKIKSAREIELIKKAQEELQNESREEILQNKPNPRGFRKFLFPQLTPGGPLGMVTRRMVEDRQNWPENEKKEM